MRFQQQLNIRTDVIDDYALVGQQEGRQYDERRTIGTKPVAIKSLSFWLRQKYFSGISITWEDGHESTIGNTGSNAKHTDTIDISKGVSEMSIGDGKSGANVSEVIVTNHGGTTLIGRRKNKHVASKVAVNVGNHKLYGFRYILGGKKQTIAGLGAYFGQTEEPLTINLLQYNTHLFADSTPGGIPFVVEKTIYEDYTRRNLILENKEFTQKQDIICFNEVWAQKQRTYTKNFLAREENGDFQYSYIPGSGTDLTHTSDIIPGYIQDGLDIVASTGVNALGSLWGGLPGLSENLTSTSGLVFASKIQKQVDLGIHGENFVRYQGMEGYEILSTKGVAWVNLMAPYPTRLVFTHAPTGDDSLRAIKDTLPKALDGYDGLVIFCGDLNINYYANEKDATKSTISETYVELAKWLREEYNLEDCFEYGQRETTRNTDYSSDPYDNSLSNKLAAINDKGHRPEKKKNKIDHVFCSIAKPGEAYVKPNSVEVKHNAYDSVQDVHTPYATFSTLPGSDHYPVFVEFEIAYPESSIE